MFLLSFYEYNIIFLYFSITLFLGLLMFLLPFFLAPQNPDSEKLSSYECGFEPFEDARVKFDIHFYIIAILFIIFDIEILFLFPWVLHISVIGFGGYIAIVLFLLLITAGFYYEWMKKALDWS
jgi:NADH:ubiquinone oxidoreductase subunit 3 (subunit A)